MSEQNEARRTATIVTLLLGVAAVGWALLHPESLRALGRKEGPVEWVSHAVLLGAALLWGARARTPPRLLALGLAALCMVTLAEELDWGDRHGFSTVPDLLRGLTGAPNLHNAWGGLSYLLFAVPWLVFFASGVVPPAWFGGRLRWRPARDVSVGALLVGMVSLLAGLLGSDVWEPVIDELAELVFYGLVSATAWDGLRGVNPRAPEQPPA